MFSCGAGVLAWKILSAKETGLAVVGEEAKLGGVEAMEEALVEKRPKREVTVGAPVGAKDVCEVRSGGRRLSIMEEEASEAGVAVPSSLWR